MKKDEIKSLTAEEVQSKLAEERSNLQRLRFAHAISPVENPMQIRHARKLIARLETEFTLKSKKA